MAQKSDETLKRPFIDSREVARRLKLCQRTVTRHEASGKILRAAYRSGKLLRWNPDEFDAWIAAGCPSRVEWEARKAQAQLRP